MILTQSVFAEPARFRRISITDGLSNNWVRCVYHDRFGYIWVGTSGGLNRYDGVQFKGYKPLSNDSLEQGNVTINAILEKDSLNLWILTDIGMYTYHYPSDRLFQARLLPENFPFLAGAYDAAGNLWIGSNRGLIRLNRDACVDTVFRHNPSDPSSLSSDYINALFVGSDQTLWIGTKKGLNVYEPDKNVFRTFFPSPRDGSLSGNDVLSIAEDGDRRLWVGTARDGLNLLVRDSSSVSFQPILPGTILSLLYDEENTLWIGHGSGQGIERIDLSGFASGKFAKTSYKNHPGDPKTLSDNSVFCLYADRNGDIWIGTFGRGLNFYSKRAKQFQVFEEIQGDTFSIRNNLVNAFYEDETHLWVGTEGGLDRLHKETGQWKHFGYETDNPRSLASNPVFKIFKDSRGNLWMGNWSGGLNLFDPRNESFIRHLPGDEPGSLSNENVFDILEDSRGNLWITTVGGGLNRYDYATGTFEHFMHNPRNPCSIHGNFLNTLLETSTGELYVSLYNMVDRFDYETRCFSHIIHNPSTNDSVFYGNVIDIFEDSRQNLWFATNTGLEYYNPVKKTFKRYTTGDGLPDNTIQGILEDAHGNLWMGTNHGLSKMIHGVELPDRPRFINFSAHDGLPANDFKKRAAYENQAGWFYLGTSNGYVCFHPDSIHFNPVVPEVVLTGFTIMDPSGSKKLPVSETNINFTDEVILPYNNADFTVSFAALNYLNPGKNQYKYRLEGRDEEWFYLKNQTSVTYTNLRPGEYIFQMMGSNNDGVWNPVPKTLTIRIIPLWWQTFGFKATVFLVVILMILLGVWFRLSTLDRYNKILEKAIAERTGELVQLNALLKNKQKKISEQNAALARHKSELEVLVHERTTQLEKEKVKAEESYKLKSSFLANMSHEIRTPLNAILGFTSLLAQNSVDEEHRKKYIELINSNSKLLFFLINDIIDISIIESNQLVLNKTRFNAKRILSDFINFYNFRGEEFVRFSFVNQYMRETLFIVNDAVRFRQVMSNLLNNAFKYTKDGKIEYGYRIQKANVLFYVSDTGIGIKKEEQEKIFDDFYKSKQEKGNAYGGTGIGLALCKRLVHQMGGRIWVESEVNKGSTFFFELPY